MKRSERELKVKCAAMFKQRDYGKKLLKNAKVHISIFVSGGGSINKQKHGIKETWTKTGSGM